MKRKILVGNGFISHLKIMVSEYDYFGFDSELIEDLDNTYTLFDGFVEIERILKEEVFKTNVDNELLYGVIDDFVKWFKSFSNKEDLNPCFEKFYEVGEEVFIKHIFPVFSKFHEYEKLGTYSRLFNSLKSFKIGTSISNYKGKIEVYTTNYDGYLDQILRNGDDNSENKGFVFKDGFGYSNDKLVLKKERLSEGKIICHLHSSYKYGMDYDKDLIKINNSNDIQDITPVLVYRSPKSKIKYIRENYILKTYWEIFETKLEEEDELVIYGYSFDSDPHIKESIQRQISENTKIFIINTKVGFKSVINNISNSSLHNKIYCIDSKDINFKNFHNIFTSPSNLPTVRVIN